MPFDLNVCVIGQEKTSNFLGNSSKINISYDSNVPRYETWQFIYQLKGVWYYLGMEEDGLYNAASFCDSNFEISEDKLPIPHWIKNEEVSYHLTPLIIKKKYQQELKDIINFLIDESPQKMIMFFARYQGGNQEIVQGVIPLNEFFDLLYSEAILFNVCYIIRKPSIETCL